MAHTATINYPGDPMHGEVVTIEPIESLPGDRPLYMATDRYGIRFEVLADEFTVLEKATR